MSQCICPLSYLPCYSMSRKQCILNEAFSTRVQEVAAFSRHLITQLLKEFWEKP